LRPNKRSAFAVTSTVAPVSASTANQLKPGDVYRGNQYWPAHYFFDAKGQLRYASFGEGNYEKQEQVIEQLLKDART
jgi:NADPH-dependent curcumin reductase CurA